ncbi:MAG: DUF1566 domain-containing protein [Methylococcaceae bacterium]|nr:MAG: DUF1566 domain-containing protein [Methylococcaceae bacterium]
MTHKTTGLTWMRCSLGQTWTGSSCYGTAHPYIYRNALTLTQNFAGHDDWRLPNIAELHTIVERERYKPSINTEIFPNTPTVSFWSSSGYADNPDNAWAVSFNSGGDSNYRTSAFTVRLVRGGQPSGAFTPTGDFVDNRNGTVTHKKTGLTWMRCAVGQTWNGSTCSGLPSVHAWQDAVELTTVFANQRDWRLPTQAELLTLMDYGAYSPAVNTTLFPNPSNNWFWSASAYVGNPLYAWFASFNDGGGYTDVKTGKYAVRLVRDGQSIAASSAGVDLTTRLVDSPDPVKPGADLTYTATVKNQGPADASGVVLRFYLPRAVQFVSAPAGCQYGGLSVVCPIGQMAADAAVSKAIVVKMSTAGGMSFAASASSDEQDSQPNDNIARAVTTIRP